MTTELLTETLDKIGIKHNTDKASITKHRDGSLRRGHNYLQFYEYFFKEFRRDAIKILELGVGPEWRSGASLFTFREYFQNAHIYGVDIRESAASIAGPRLDIFIGDLGSTMFLNELKAIKPYILIDDASHFWHHQVMALCALWPSIQRGGYYVVEDIHTSFGRFKEAGHHCGGQVFTAYRFLEIIAELKQDPNLEHGEISSELLENARRIARQSMYITFYRHTVLLKKL